MLISPVAPVPVPSNGNGGVVPPWLTDPITLPVEPTEPPVVTLPIDEPLLVPKDWR